MPGVGAGADHVRETAQLLESAVLALAAGTIGSWQIQAARNVNDRLAGMIEHGASHRQLARQFHRILIDACPNRRMVTLLDIELGKMAASDDRSSAEPASIHRAVCDHERILGLVERHADWELIESEIREHFLHSSLCSV